MNPEDSVINTECNHTKLSELPTMPELAAGQEHAYVVPWELHDAVTMNPRAAFDDEWFG